MKRQRLRQQVSQVETYERNPLITANKRYKYKDRREDWVGTSERSEDFVLSRRTEVGHARAGDQKRKEKTSEKEGRIPAVGQ